jgi:hypothetical protein
MLSKKFGLPLIRVAATPRLLMQVQKRIDDGIEGQL